jgi:hypothetical protein
MMLKCGEISNFFIFFLQIMSDTESAPESPPLFSSRVGRRRQTQVVPERSRSRSRSPGTCKPLQLSLDSSNKIIVTETPSPRTPELIDGYPVRPQPQEHVPESPVKDLGKGACCHVSKWRLTAHSVCARWGVSDYASMGYKEMLFAVNAAATEEIRLLKMNK